MAAAADPPFIQGALGQEPPGATPLEEEELEGLKPSWVTTRGDLNEVEYDGILNAEAKWTRRRSRIDQLLDDKTVRDLHRDMFGQVWKWAGRYRLTEKNIGIDPVQVPVKVRDLVEDAAYWFAASSPLGIDQAAVRFHHKLVFIHPFPNGNGRHARLLTDLLLRALSAPAFTWGGGEVRDLGTPGDVRAAYLTALRTADVGDYDRLLKFVRS